MKTTATEGVEHSERPGFTVVGVVASPALMARGLINASFDLLLLAPGRHRHHT